MTEKVEKKRQGKLSFSCPFPIKEYPNILLAHGGGGRLMHQLIETLFAKAFNNQYLDSMHDSAVLQVDDARIAFTTDSYIVNPLIYPGGDIGSLAVNGTVNDLAMSGASPVWLSAGFIIEEGFRVDKLSRITDSMRNAASAAGVSIVTGDTKVVDRGKGDGLFINTAGIGLVKHNLTINPASIKPGDAVILSGDIGRHGIAVMAVRERLELESTVESDCAPLNRVVDDLIAEGLNIHCMRDLTRGGLGSALVEIAEASKLHIQVDETSIPVISEVTGACEMLGLDPLYIANEGRFIIILPEDEADKALDVMLRHDETQDAVIIGKVEPYTRGLVTMRTLIGASRLIDMLSGEQLPRIC